MLSLSDEYVDMISQASCQLAKHRKSATIDRKDVQFAYESLFGRPLPGFSSDAIRLDQSRSSRRPPVSQQRAAKLKLVNDAKAAWRKDKEEAAKQAESAAIAAEAAMALGVPLANGSVSFAGTGAVTAIDGTPATSFPPTAAATASGTPANGVLTLPGTASPSGVNTPALDGLAVIVSAPPVGVVV
jgi:hypothetical protein